MAVYHSDGQYFSYEQSSQTSNTTLSIAKVFGYMFAGLLITALVAFGVGALFAWWLVNDPTNAENAIFISLIVSSILTIVLSLVMSFSLRKKSTLSVLIPGILYTVVVGVMLSSFTIFIDWYLLASAFLITSVIFGLMSLISLLAKKMSGVLVLGIGLVVGGGLMSLFNLIMMLVFPYAFQSFYWIISLVMFAGMMFIAMYDIYRIKIIAQQGALNKNIALYCAFTLYVDFIYIFVRILSILIKLKGDN
jgi:FtsH-binding integral membrane protein